MLKKIWLCICFFFISLLNAEIVEISHIDEIRPYISSKALYLFDIDDTLIEIPLPSVRRHGVLGLSQNCQNPRVLLCGMML